MLNVIYKYFRREPLFAKLPTVAHEIPVGRLSWLSGNEATDISRSFKRNIALSLQHFIAFLNMIVELDVLPSVAAVLQTLQYLIS